ncbi:MAG: cytochrome c3 family protein [Bacteroidota bacterium]
MAQLFPRKANALPVVSLFGALGGGVFVIAFVWYYFSPEFYEVGYEPAQPVPYSHSLHAGQLGMDCRYCHNHAENAAHANIPPTQTCMNCHAQIKTQSLALLPVRESWATGEPIEWVQVTHLADYARFPHNAHVAVGVGCESCHGRVDQMPVVWVAEPMSMGWCLECHRNPEEYLRDPELVTVMGYAEEVRASEETYEAYIEANLARIAAEGINPPENCSACHY